MGTKERSLAPLAQVPLEELVPPAALPISLPSEEYKALEHGNHVLQDQHLEIQSDCVVLRKQYQTLYEQFQVLAEFSPSRQGKYPVATAFGEMLQDFRQSQKELR
jgi:hypothetical protein